jgi:hypothetical protein
MNEFRSKEIVENQYLHRHELSRDQKERKNKLVKSPSDPAVKVDNADDDKFL